MKYARLLSLLIMIVLSLGSSRLSARGGDATDSSGTSAVSSPVVFYQDVSWSPAGDVLLLSRMDIAGDDYTHRIFRVRADGSGYAPLTQGPHDIWTSWSPNGDRIAYSSTVDGNADIYTMSTAADDVVRLTMDPATDTHPDWSATGRIAFSSKRDGVSQIHLMSSDGEGQRSLTGGPVRKWNPRWSPDGGSIAYFGSVENGTDSVYVVGPDGSTPVAMAAGIWPVWSADGGKIAFVRDNVVYEMDSGGGEARRLIEDAGYARYSPNGASVAFIRHVWRSPKGWPAASALFLATNDDVPVRVELQLTDAIH